MKTVYACTRVTKTACVDDYENGCETKSRTIMDEPCDIQSDSLAELIEDIGNTFYLDIDDVFLPDDGEDSVSHIGYNRLENNECEPPTEREKEDWKRREIKLYLADYTFAVEKRQTSDIPVAEFAAAGIKTH